MKRKILIIITIVMLFTLTLIQSYGAIIPTDAPTTSAVFIINRDHPEAFEQFNYYIASNNNLYAFDDMSKVTISHSSSGYTRIDISANNSYIISKVNGTATLNTATLITYIYYETTSDSEIKYSSFDIYSNGVLRLKKNILPLYETSFDSTIDDTISYTNDTSNIRKVDLYSYGISNVTINSPTRFAGTSDIGTSKNIFSILPNETISVTRNSGDTIYLSVQSYQRPPVTEITGDYAIISNPPDDYQTVSKLVSYWITYQVSATNATDVTINIRNLAQQSLNSDPNVKRYDLSKNISTFNNGVIKGFIQVDVEYISSFIGVNGLLVNIETPLKVVSDSKSITVVSFIDSDADGFDDFTGDEPYQEPDFFDPNAMPDRDSYGDDVIGEIQFQFDKLFYYVTMPFKMIGSTLTSIFDWFEESTTWLQGFSNLFKVLFGWLPDEIVGILTVVITTLLVFTIIKVVRN